MGLDGFRWSEMAIHLLEGETTSNWLVATGTWLYLSIQLGMENHPN
jgi:hypothetical protein